LPLPLDGAANGSITMKVFVLLGVLALSNGAVIKQEDQIFNAVQSFLAEPETFASSLGMSRVKRSTYDKAFNFNAMGVEVGIDYKDPNNKLKGGKLDLTIDNLKRLVPNARSEKVKVSFNFDGGVSTTDGLFEMTVDYELNHQNKEVGQFKVVRSKSGNEWHTVVEVIPKSGAVKIFTAFKIDLKSDRKTYAKGFYNSERFGNYEINVDRIPMKQMIATVTGMGHVYKITGDLDISNYVVDVKVEKDGAKLATAKLDADYTAKDYAFKADLTMVGTGNVKVDLSGPADFSNINFEVKLNDRVVLATKTRTKIDKDKVKAEMRYVGMGNIKEGKIKFAINKKGSFLFEYLPKEGLDLKITVNRVVSGDVTTWKGLATRNGEEYLKYDNKITRKATNAAYTIDAESKFHVSEKSKLYPVFCTYGCFNDRTMDAKVYIDKARPHKFSVDVHLFKDSVNVLTLEMNTRNSPYVFKILAPRILPKILPTKRESIEFSADHKPGQYLKVTSNTNAISSFSVEKTGNGEERKITLNGKELVRGSASRGNNEISNTIKLPDGKHLTTTIKWRDDDMQCNKVEVILAGSERKLNAFMEWDVKKPAAMTFKLDADGENTRWGKYQLKREGTFGAVNNKLTADWTGFSSFQNVPWPNPVNTKLNANLDFNTNDFVASVSKEAAGKTVSMSYNNGRISIDF